MTFIIGEGHGLPESVLEQVAERLPLSNLTFSKEVARVVLLEQCYRCSCILTGDPYHTGLAE